MHRIFKSFIACLLAVPLWAGAQVPFSRVVVFGTSLSDPGNAFAIRGGNATPHDYTVDPFLVPDKPYARGGHHFSNGPTWIEQLAKSMDLAASVRPAYRGSNAGASNYAVSGARASQNAVGSVRLLDQLGVFLQDFGNVAPSDALYVIEVGGNDVRDLLFGVPAGTVVPSALASISTSIQTLYARGARHFLVVNVPDLGKTPALLGIGAGPVATAVTADFNDAVLFNVIMPLQGLGIDIQVFDAFGTVQEIVGRGDAEGLTNVHSACITPKVPPFHCSNPHQFLFWDGIHPTTAGHAIIARKVAEQLAN